MQVFDYPGSGHLFADSSRADEYQRDEAELLLSRLQDFLDEIDQVLDAAQAEQAKLDEQAEQAKLAELAEQAEKAGDHSSD